MKTFITIHDTKNCLNSFKKEGKTIGFVPTMGALHKGHIALLERAKRENVISVVSVFVNPLQFNDKKDLEKYPRNLEKDSEMLKKAHCDVVFVSSSEEMYPPSPFQPLSDSQETGKGRIGESESPLKFDLGNLDKVMEGLHRPGHFQGVCVVVKKLFDIVEPTKAYFGEKDFQQLAVIKHMVKALKLPVEIVSCPTVREADGLAMSSRNTLLTTEERKNASHIYKILIEAKVKLVRWNTDSVPLVGEEWKDGMLETAHSSMLPAFQPSIADLKKWVKDRINENPYLKLEYFEIVNSETLEPITDYRSPAVGLRACIAVKAGAIRLIDNISL